VTLPAMMLLNKIYLAKDLPAFQEVKLKYFTQVNASVLDVHTTASLRPYTVTMIARLTFAAHFQKIFHH
jgi:hypothetical protein